MNPIQEFLKDQSDRLLNNNAYIKNNGLYIIYETGEIKTITSLIAKKISNNDIIIFKEIFNTNVIEYSDMILIEKDNSATPNICLLKSKHNLLMWNDSLYDVSDSKSIDDAISYLTNSQFAEIRNYTFHRMESRKILLFKNFSTKQKTEKLYKSNIIKNVFFNSIECEITTLLGKNCTYIPFKSNSFICLVSHRMIKV